MILCAQDLLSKERLNRRPAARLPTNLHIGSCMVLLRFATAGNGLRQGKEAPCREEGQLPRRQLAQDTEEAEPPPCPGQTSLFLAF